VARVNWQTLAKVITQVGFSLKKTGILKIGKLFFGAHTIERPPEYHHAVYSTFRI
jgi:hypothetical protein